MLMGLALSVWFVGNMEQEQWQQAIRAGRQSLGNLADSGGQMEVDKGTMILVRGLLPVAWILTSFTVAGAVCLYVSWIFFGFASGMFGWLLLSVAGWRGPFAMWALLFPQYLAYLPGLLLWYIGCLRWCQLRKKRPVSCGDLIKIPEGRLFLLRLSLGGMMYLAGFWLEIRINPWIYERFFTIS